MTPGGDGYQRPMTAALLAQLAAIGGGGVALLSLVALALIVWGIIKIARGDVAVGILLIVVGLLIGPGGVSIWH